MDIVDDDLSEQGPTQDAPAPDIQEKKWWTDDDDTILLTQVNNERPFMQRKDTTKAWESMAATLRSVVGFSRTTLDGKKAQNRFLLLMRQYKTQNDVSARLSGVDEDETAKSKLLDDLVPLYKDATAKKKSMIASEAALKAGDTKFVRDQAMSRGRRQSTSDSEQVGPTSTGKRRMILDAQQLEIALEREKMAFKKVKFEREMEEKEKDRLEREKERQERQQIRDIENRRNEEMMRIIRHFIEKS